MKGTKYSMIKKLFTPAKVFLMLNDESSLLKCFKC